MPCTPRRQPRHSGLTGPPKPEYGLGYKSSSALATIFGRIRLRRAIGRLGRLNPPTCHRTDHLSVLVTSVEVEIEGDSSLRHRSSHAQDTRTFRDSVLLGSFIVKISRSSSHHQPDGPASSNPLSATASSRAPLQMTVPGRGCPWISSKRVRRPAEPNSPLRSPIRQVQSREPSISSISVWAYVPF